MRFHNATPLGSNGIPLRTVQLSEEGEPVVTPLNALAVEPAPTLAELLRRFVLVQCDRRQWSMQDAITGLSLCQQLNKTLNAEYIEIGNLELAWLQEQIKAVAPKLFGIDAAIISNAISKDSAVKDKDIAVKDIAAAIKDGSKSYEG